MPSDLIKLGVSVPDLIFRGAVVYFAVILLLRIGGKKQVGQLGATEFVAVLLISNAVQNAMNGGDNSLIGGLILAVVLIALSWAVSYLTYRSRIVRAIFEGTPTLLIHKGRVIDKHLAAELITRNELKTMLRKVGVHALSEVETAILESDGSLSLVRVGEKPPTVHG